MREHMQDAVSAESRTDGLAFTLAGVDVRLLPEGALWVPGEGVLVVSDLHLEKASAYAASGQFLPPHDSAQTLQVVEALCARLGPRVLVSLGDSLHDGGAVGRMAAPVRARVAALTAAREVIWIAGNHDPAPPTDWGGRSGAQWQAGGLIFRHEPSGQAGEVAGHLHPCVRVAGRARSVRTKCFLSDGQSLIMPAMGAFTGGLCVTDQAFEGLFAGVPEVFALGAGRVHRIAASRVLGQGVPRRPPWRMGA
jgi:DNA ligase-associated metallophosphoesterase